MQATQPTTRPRVRIWQHLRILLGIFIVCSGWGFLLQTSTQGSSPAPMHGIASHPA
jgi:hypothetical protein